jgi:hypothetical protein
MRPLPELIIPSGLLAAAANYPDGIEEHGVAVRINSIRRIIPVQNSDSFITKAPQSG